MVPMPRAVSFAELNAQLLECCRRRLNDRLRGHDETIGERLVRDREALLPLPPAPYDACEKKPAWVSSLSLVRYRGNDYSVPTAYGHREVLVRGYVREDHDRLWRGGDRPAHSFLRARRLRVQPLALSGVAGAEDRGALDQAAPLVGWDLPDEFAILRQLLKRRLSKRGKREFVQVLRLLGSL